MRRNHIPCNDSFPNCFVFMINFVFARCFSFQANVPTTRVAALCVMARKRYKYTNTIVLYLYVYKCIFTNYIREFIFAYVVYHFILLFFFNPVYVLESSQIKANHGLLVFCTFLLFSAFKKKKTQKALILNLFKIIQLICVGCFKIFIIFWQTIIRIFLSFL